MRNIFCNAPALMRPTYSVITVTVTVAPNAENSTMCIILPTPFYTKHPPPPAVLRLPVRASCVQATRRLRRSGVLVRRRAKLLFCLVRNAQERAAREREREKEKASNVSRLRRVAWRRCHRRRWVGWSVGAGWCVVSGDNKVKVIINIQRRSRA